MPAVWHRGRKEREEYFEKGVEEEPQRSGSKRRPLVADPQKSHRENWGKSKMVPSETCQDSKSLPTATALSLPP